MKQKQLQNSISKCWGILFKLLLSCWIDSKKYSVINIYENLSLLKTGKHSPAASWTINVLDESLL